MRSATLIAILVGGATGAAAALVREPPPELPAPELRPVAAPPAPTAPPAKPPKAAAVSTPPALAPAAGASARPPRDDAPAPRTPQVNSRYELTGYEIACHEKKDPGACRAAASAYEEGKVVSSDLARSKLFRKIELTFLVKHCEAQLPAACSDLAYRYQRGDGVPRNERTAQTLLQRARELCAGRRSDVCSELGEPR